MIYLIFLILVFIFITKRYESFVSLDSLVLNLKNPNINKEHILKESKELRSNSGISLSNKNADDKLISEFIAKQLGKEDTGTPDSYDTNSDMLKYPKEKAEREAPPMKPSVKVNYEEILESQARDIKNRKDKQDLLLRNIKYELLKINEYKKPIFNIKNQNKRQ